MKAEIIQCLGLTLVPDSATVQNATQKLTEMSKQPGTFFCYSRVLS